MHGLLVGRRGRRMMFGGADWRSRSPRAEWTKSSEPGASEDGSRLSGSAKEIFGRGRHV